MLVQLIITKAKQTRQRKVRDFELESKLHFSLKKHRNLRIKGKTAAIDKIHAKGFDLKFITIHLSGPNWET